jgi:hypothetical protein
MAGQANICGAPLKARHDEMPLFCLLCSRLMMLTTPGLEPLLRLFPQVSA